MSFPEVAQDCLYGCFVRDRISEDRVIQTIPEGFDDLRSGCEVHIGHPERQNVGVLIFVPFEGAVSLAIGTFVKVV